MAHGAEVVAGQTGNTRCLIVDMLMAGGRGAFLFENHA
jgi:hypothetical protein